MTMTSNKKYNSTFLWHIDRVRRLFQTYYSCYSSR